MATVDLMYESDFQPEKYELPPDAAVEIPKMVDVMKAMLARREGKIEAKTEMKVGGVTYRIILKRSLLR